METAALRARRPVSCGSAFAVGGGRRLKIEPRVVTSVVPSRFTTWQTRNLCYGVPFGITAASADFSTRRNRKTSGARPGGSSPKGFMPKAPVGTSTQKKDTEKDGQKKGTGSPAREHSALELKSEFDEEQDLELIQRNEIDEERNSESGDYLEDTATASIDSAALTTEQDRFVKNGSLVRDSEEVVESPQKEVASMRDIDDAADIADDNRDALKSNEQDDDAIKVKSFELDEERIHEDFLKPEMEPNLQKQEAEAAQKLEMEANLQKREVEAALKLEMEVDLRKQEAEAALKLEMEANLPKTRN
ncbi:hypothetical protein NL676_013186 [Syzygium grande]|nr:hypothetical protein NL676_013186 [Syzygium grande]